MLGTAVLAACVLILALDLPKVAIWREALFDAYQKLLPRSRASAPAVIVAIDEAALEARGQWPWPRALAADLVRAIAGAGPAAIGVDLLFVEPDRSAPGADAALAQALDGQKVALGIAGLDYRDRRFPHAPQAAPVRQSSTRELPLRRFEGHLQSRTEVDRAAAGRGLLSVDSPDRVIRRVPLVARIGEVMTPALSVEMVRVAAGLPGLRIEDRGGERVALVLGDLAIPVQSDGSLRPYFGRHDPARFVSAEDVLSGKAPPELLRDKLVLIGVTGLGLLDFQATPLGERIPGVEIHAQILEQMFDGVYLRRPTGAGLIEAALLAAAGLLFIVLVPRGRAAVSALLLAVVLIFYTITGLLAFKAGLVLDVAGPALGTMVVFGALLTATLAELREAQARIAGELEAARRIQMGLLPAPRHLFAGESRFAVDAGLEPARSVGGDFYDCFMLDRDRLFFTVADVSGKGLPASLFMALSKSLLKSIALRDGADPAAILTRANAEIARDNPESFFVTAFAGVLDARSGVLEFCNAGHEPPYLCGPAAAPERLEHPGGPPLCVLERFAYPCARRSLGPGETLCVVTDGVTEAMDRTGAFYGAARLRAVLGREADVAAVRDDVQRFAGGAERADDLTLLCVRWNGPASS
ncbi:MAG TPA: CHASE2 domain-containing protein [Burkholderiales bacterium]|nr:CHASE2 domain-containing protein [Burkholderiales bacterium]